MPVPYTDESLITGPIVSELEVCEALLIEIRDLLQILVDNQGAGSTNASKLVNEFMSNEDLDDNGMIYGKDFMIDEEDEDIPPIVKQIHQNSEWSDPETTKTWSEYLSTLPE